MSPETPTGAPARARHTLLAGLTILLSGVLALLPTVASATPTAAPTVAQLTQRVVDDTNAVRADAGLPLLVRNADLDTVAADWARRQWENGAMSHNPDYAAQIPAGWQRAGENVAKGYTYTQVVTAWVNSPSHYANLVHDYTSVGVGYYEANGSRYWSQVFAKYARVKQPTAPAAETPTPPTSPGTGSTASPAAEPAAPAGTAIPLSSPSFENGLGAWNAPGSRIDGPNDDARGGTRSLLVTGRHTVTQTVATPVAAGATHTAVVWVRADGNARGTLTLRSVGGSGAAETASVTFGAAAEGWLRVPVSLTAKRDHTGFTIEFTTSTSGREYRVDSVSLTRTVEPAAASTPAPGPVPTAPAPTAPDPAPAAPTPDSAPSTEPAAERRPLLDLGWLLFGRRD